MRPAPHAPHTSANSEEASLLPPFIRVVVAFSAAQIVRSHRGQRRRSWTEKLPPSSRCRGSGGEVASIIFAGPFVGPRHGLCRAPHPSTPSLRRSATNRRYLADGECVGVYLEPPSWRHGYCDKSWLSWVGMGIQRRAGGGEGGRGGGCRCWTRRDGGGCPLRM